MKRATKFWGEEFTVTEKQIEFVISLRCYRRQHNLSQAEMADVCTLLGEQEGVKFNKVNISNYESFKYKPYQSKFQILSKVLNLNDQ